MQFPARSAEMSGREGILEEVIGKGVDGVCVLKVAANGFVEG